MLQPNSLGIKLLLSKIAEGDENAFRKLFLEYAPFLQLRLARLIQNVVEQEDIIQETFLRIWLNRDQLPEIENWNAWLLKIGYNRAFTYLYKQRIRQNGLAGLKTNVEKNLTEDDFEFRILQEVIKKAIIKLPERQRKIYLLNRENGLKIAEISEKLNLSGQTVKNHLGLALKAIRSALEAQGYVLSIFTLFVVEFM